MPVIATTSRNLGILDFAGSLLVPIQDGEEDKSCSIGGSDCDEMRSTAIGRNRKHGVV